MTRTTIMLPTELKTRAARRAKQMGVSLGELIRESLEAALSGSQDRDRSDPLFDDTAVFGGAARRDLAANHDEHLYGETYWCSSIRGHRS